MLPDTLARALRDHLDHRYVRDTDGEPVRVTETRPNEFDRTVTPIQASPVFTDGPGFWLKIGDDTFTVRVTRD